MSTILVIEDETDLRNSLYDILDISGYSVLTASNGEEGCNSILENKPDLVICDINMPKMNGYEVLSTMHEKLGVENSPIFLFLSARAQLNDIKAGLEMGADEYITKPFEAKELIKVVKSKLVK